MNDTTWTIIRSIPKILGTVLVTTGVMNQNDANSLMPAADAIIGGVMVIGGFIWSHYAHKEK